MKLRDGIFTARFAGGRRARREIRTAVNGTPLATADCLVGMISPDCRLAAVVYHSLLYYSLESIDPPTAN